MNKNKFPSHEQLIKVKYRNRLVGTLAHMQDGKTAFAYDDDWLADGFPISPFSLPLEKKVFVPGKSYFDGLFGIFADSLPDAWGQILLNRMLKKYGLPEDQMTITDRLAVVGKSGMGALEYEPDYQFKNLQDSLNLDHLAAQCRRILMTEYAEDLDTLFQMGGTSGGARPKIMTEYNNKDWIIKFPAHVDRNDIGKMEFDYAECARKCGIDIPETRLFPSTECSGYFGVVRFDRIKENSGCRKVHMATAAALLEADFRTPCLDYHTLMKLTRILTQENQNDIKEMFRRACFNVFAHNRDDHAKNFSFLYYDEEDRWHLSPAYDLTYSNTYYGDHMTSVDGNGTDPGENELLQVGIKAGMKKNVCTDIIQHVRDTVHAELREYLF